MQHSPFLGRHVITLLFMVILVSMFPLGMVPIPVVAAQEDNESASAAFVTKVDEVIENWNSHQHLFVKGDVGATSEQLNKLEQWLDENGVHWTVVLMHNARDEVYTAPDGERFRKMDAVEYALAHRLANQTEFGNLVHEKTGESSGAVFVLYLVERQFAYYSTDVYDRRGLGQSRWVGNLDREAIRAMRSGDRIIDAVKNTVKQIESRLAAQILREERDERLAKEQVKRERAKYLGNLQSLIAETESTLIPRVEESARSVRTKFPDASESDLAKPPVENWRSGLKGLRKESENPDFETADLRTSKDFQSAKKGVDEIRTQINRHLDSYAAHQSFEEMIYTVEARLDAIADHPSGVAGQSSLEAYQLLDEARAGHARGELGFASSIETVKELIEEGELAISTEQKRLKKAADQKRLVRRTLAIVAACLAIGFLGLLWLLNIRRRPALRRAHALFEKQSKAVATELAKVDEVVTESETIVGTPESFSESKYEGETLRLGNWTHQQIGDLKTMASEANRAIESCHELIQPSNPIAEAANMFTGARYEHCVNDLNGKTLHVPGRRDETGVASEPIWLSFDQFFTDLHDRKNEAIESLVVFDSSVNDVNKQVQGLQEKINETIELEKQLSRSSRLDRIFKVPALFDSLIPSAQKVCDRAESLAEADPVKAVSVVVPDGLQKINDGLGIANAIGHAREHSLPKMEASSKELKVLDFDNRWIAESVGKLSDRADRILLKATSENMTDEVNRFNDDMVGLAHRVSRTHELANLLSNDLHSRDLGLNKLIRDSRNQIAKELKIDVSKALSEEDYNPDRESEQAKKQLLAARSSLDYGGVESAMESIEEFEIEFEHAEKLVQMSVAALSEYETRSSEQNSVFESLRKRIPHAQATIQSIKDRYADSALTLRDEEFVAGSWDDLEPDENAPTVNHLVDSVRELVDHSQVSITQLNANHHSGRILQAANSLDLLTGDLELIGEMLDEIAEHGDRVDQLASGNVEALETTTKKLGALGREMNDERTQRPTVQQHLDLSNRLAGFQNVFSNPSVERDPFGDAILIGEFDSQLVDLSTALKADRRAYEEASRAVGGAESELAASRNLVSKSINDGVPDSRAITASQDEVTRLESELGEVKQLLQVAHENWKVVDSRATQINSKLGIVNGRVRQELELAQQAVDMLARGADAVYEAANWRGSYSIVVIGRPGSDDLDHARRALSQGNYVRSIEFSKSAKLRARRAIEQAQQQVTRYRRKLAREAQARRRRERMMSSFSIGSSSSRSSSFGSSSRSSRRSSSSSFSGSSSSSSSSSSRSSGFRRSGW